MAVYVCAHRFLLCHLVFKCVEFFHQLELLVLRGGELHLTVVERLAQHGVLVLEGAADDVPVRLRPLAPH